MCTFPPVSRQMRYVSIVPKSSLPASAAARAPGTLLSPWTHRNYTPMYYLVAGEGEVKTPPHEPVEMRFLEPEAAIASGLMAEPEILALGRALAR